MKFPLFPRISLLAFGLLTSVFAALAQSAPTGTIEGRVSNPATSEFLELVRITVEGTALETFTDATGQYRLTHVPAGIAQVKAFRTGTGPLTRAVAVSAETVATERTGTARRPPLALAG